MSMMDATPCFSVTSFEIISSDVTTVPTWPNTGNQFPYRKETTMPNFVTAKAGGLVLYAIGKDSEPTQAQIDHMLKNGALGPALDAVREQVGLSIRTRSLTELWKKACDSGTFPESERGNPTVFKLPPALMAAEAT